MSIGQGKVLSKHNTRYKIVFVRAYHVSQYKSVAKIFQMLQYLFIAILCAKMSRVTWAQKERRHKPRIRMQEFNLD